MKPVIEIQLDSPREILLRTIREEEIEFLRDWKNAHREFFFHREVIDTEQQRAWYREYVQRLHDHLFVVIVEGERVGCIGARLLSGTVDLYNVILGDKRYAGTGIMSAALDAIGGLAGFLYPGRPIRMKVLTGNPAISWYERNGYEILGRAQDYVLMGGAGRICAGALCRMTLAIPFER